MKLEVASIYEETSLPGKEKSVILIKQFVKNVCDFSSQYGSNISISYSAYNIAGHPSKFPDYGDFPQTFVMVYNRNKRCVELIIWDPLDFIFSLYFQRTYGPWWDKAPSRLIDYVPQNNEDVVSQDYIGT